MNLAKRKDTLGAAGPTFSEVQPVASSVFGVSTVTAPRIASQCARLKNLAVVGVSITPGTEDKARENGLESSERITKSGKFERTLKPNMRGLISL